MTKIDLKKDLKHLYNPSKKNFAVVEVPAMNFLMVDGRGDPNTSADYQAAIEALFSLSYTLKFMLKKSGAVDYAVMPLEGLWWVDDVHRGDLWVNKDEWYWTAMMMQPDVVAAEHIAAAIEEVRRKKAPSALDKVRFEQFNEGLAAQILYTGPYADEKPTIDRLHHFIVKSGCQLAGKHHEIYLNDFRRTAPDKLKTVIRQPMRKG
jgi:hypothetical protein